MYDDPIALRNRRDVIVNRLDDSGGFDAGDVREEVDVTEPELREVEPAVLALDQFAVHAVDAAGLETHPNPPGPGSGVSTSS